MIPITYIRSSSYNCHSMCPMKYFAEYTLGWTGKTGKKAAQGTVLHKVMEILAHIKLSEQLGKDYYEDEVFGKFSRDTTNLDNLIDTVYEYYSTMENHLIWGSVELKECRKWCHKALELNNGQFHPYNQTIVVPEQHFNIPINQDWAKYEYEVYNSTTQKTETVVGQLRLQGTIDLIIKNNEDTNEIIDYKGLPLDTPIPTINGWTTMEDIKVGDVIFDKDGKPTTVTGKSQVKHKNCFEIVFDDTSSVVCDDEHLWLLNDGSVKVITDLQKNDKIDVAKKLKNSTIIPEISPLSSTRTIIEINPVDKQHTQCIIVDSPSHTYLCTKNLIPTHNTGQRKNWATNEKKEYPDFYKDFQLRLYNYAHHVLFPDVKNVLTTIFFVNDGGPYTIALGLNDISETMDMVREKFEFIKNTIVPEVKYGFPCKTFCHLGKKTFEGTNVPSIIAKEKHVLTQPGEPLKMCDQIKYALEHRNIGLVIENMTKTDFEFDSYKAPGEVEE